MPAITPAEARAVRGPVVSDRLLDAANLVVVNNLTRAGHSALAQSEVHQIIGPNFDPDEWDALGVLYADAGWRVAVWSAHRYTLRRP